MNTLMLRTSLLIVILIAPSAVRAQDEPADEEAGAESSGSEEGPGAAEETPDETPDDEAPEAPADVPADETSDPAEPVEDAQVAAARMRLERAEAQAAAAVEAERAARKAARDAKAQRVRDERAAKVRKRQHARARRLEEQTARRSEEVARWTERAAVSEAAAAGARAEIEAIDAAEDSPEPAPPAPTAEAPAPAAAVPAATAPATVVAPAPVSTPHAVMPVVTAEPPADDAPPGRRTGPPDLSGVLGSALPSDGRSVEVYWSELHVNVGAAPPQVVVQAAPAQTVVAAAPPAASNESDATDLPRGKANRAETRRNRSIFKRARDGRPFGVSLALGGTAFGWGVKVKESPGPLLSPGIQVQLNPFWGLSIMGGWGLSRVTTHSWWAGARWLPLRTAGTFLLGGGIVGEIIGRPEDRVMQGNTPVPFFPYAEVGASITLPVGLSIELGVDVVLQPAELQRSQIWPFLRVGVLF